MSNMLSQSLNRDHVVVSQLYLHSQPEGLESVYLHLFPPQPLLKDLIVHLVGKSVFAVRIRRQIHKRIRLLANLLCGSECYLRPCVH